MKKYLVVPDCSDLNRGDQALVWETIRLAKDAGYKGEYYIQSEPSLSPQSIARGIKCFSPILQHPSRNSRTNNITYSKAIKIKWGLVAIRDLFSSLSILLVSKRYNSPLIKLFLSKETQATLGLYTEASAVFVKGGGFLQSYGGITTFYYIYYHLYPILLANKIGVPVHILPNSFGPLDGLTAKWQIHKALKKCKTCACRESISYNYMVKTFSDINFILTDDLGFYLQANNAINFPINAERPLIALTVRPYRFPEHKEENNLYEKYILAITEFSKYLYAEGYLPVFVQHTLSINSHEDDAHSISEICNSLPRGTYSIIKNNNYNCEDLKQIYSKFQYIIGTRFHSVIFSLGCKVPAISIAYGGNKSTGIMYDNNLGDYVINIDEITKETLIEKFKLMVKNREQYIDLIEKQLEIMNVRRNNYVKALIEK